MKKFIPFMIAGFTGGLAVVLISFVFQANVKEQIATVPGVEQAFTVSDSGPKFPFDFKKAAALSKPVVVHIIAEESEQMAKNRIRERNPYQRQFGFGDLFEDFFYGGGQQFYRQRGSGSGVIYSSDGYIVTNNHVVGFADKIEVTLPDNRKFLAEKIGTDPSTDLAVLKIDADNLPTIDVADSDKSEVG